MGRRIGKHLGLDVTTEQVVRGLQRLDRQGGTEGLYLWDIEVRHADVAHFAIGNQLGQCLRRLLERRGEVGPVHLVEVDVVGRQGARRLDSTPSRIHAGLAS